MKTRTKKMYDSIFPNGEMTEGWYDVMFAPVPKIVKEFHKDGVLFGIVAISLHDDRTYIINSISKDNQRFTFGMQRMIHNWTVNHKKVIIMSTLKDSTIAKFTDRFVENGDESCFVKGL